MPWIKIGITIYEKTLGETTHREDFICGGADGAPIEKGLVREILVELVRCFKGYNRCKRGHFKGA